MINPSETAAVVGGNVLTSQRIVDVIFKAFGTCAASQVRNILCTYVHKFFSCVERHGDMKFYQIPGIFKINVQAF